MKRFFEIISKYAELPKEGRPILPKRQTKNSAGYDFYALEDVVIPAHELLVGTGCDEALAYARGEEFA